MRWTLFHHSQITDEETRAQRDHIICPRSPLSPEDSHSALVCNLWKHASWFTLYLGRSKTDSLHGLEKLGKTWAQMGLKRNPWDQTLITQEERWAETPSMACDKWVIRSHLRSNLILRSWTLEKMAMASSTTRSTGKQSPDQSAGSRVLNHRNRITNCCYNFSLILEVWAGPWKSEFLTRFQMLFSLMFWGIALSFFLSFFFFFFDNIFVLDFQKIWEESAKHSHTLHTISPTADILHHYGILVTTNEHIWHY